MAATSIQSLAGLESKVTVIKTPLGAKVMQDRSVALSAVQRSALIMFDGRRSVQDVLRTIAGLGATQADIDVLFAEQLISQTNAPVSEANTSASPALESAAQSGSSGPSSDDETRFKQALNLAIELVSNTGFKGFSLTLELTGVSSMQRLQALAPEMLRVIGQEKFKPLGELLKA
jgi:hypothetical protein